MPVGIIATERAQRGGRLVVISQTGERLRELTQIGPVPVRDNGAVLSPDGRHVAFASSRSHDDVNLTSLWIVAVKEGAQPRRLTRSTTAVDRDPAWTPDGKALLFSSNRSGYFNLYRLPLREREDGPPVAEGEPIPLTAGKDLDFYPSAAPDGERIVFMRADADDERSRIFVLHGGQATALTEGPADLTPAWSPDGQRIAFAAPGKDQRDADLYTMAADGSDRQLVVGEPLADQTGPVWSADGQYLFCTSMFRSAKDHQAVFSSVTYVDLSESPRILRALHNRVAVVARMGPAPERRRLDRALLRENLAYREALQRAVESELIRAAEAVERIRQSEEAPQ